MLNLRPMNRLVVVFPIAAVLSACGNVSSQSPDGGGGSDAAIEVAAPTVDEACTMMAESLCARLATCAPFGVPLFYGDMATCTTRAKLGCTKEQEVPDIGRTAVDIAACATAARNASCDDLLANMFPAACQIKPGTRIDGEGCGSSMQCASTHCEKPAMDCGVCAARHPVNGDCTTDDACVVGLVCAAKKCVMPGAMGATCNDTLPCRGNLYCSSAGTCAMRAPAGTPCGGDANICDIFHGAGCNPFAVQQNRMCETVSVTTGGNPCGIMNGALTLCVQGNQCVGATLLQPGVCANPAADGEMCDANKHCLPPANCVTGLCRLPSVGSCPK